MVTARDRLHTYIDSLSETQAEELEQQLTGAEAPGTPNNEACEEEPIWEFALRLAAEATEEELAMLPTDGAYQHDHYIYGTPKRR